MAADETSKKLQCLYDQGSQVNLATEDAAQRLGLQRYKQSATVSVTADLYQLSVC